MPRVAWLRSVLQGVALGVAIILPGLSGGTAALLMGIYDELVHDFSHFRWRPYLPLVAGVAVGVLGGARGTAWLLAAVPNLLAAFLLGVILASAWRVFRRHERPGPAAIGAWFLGIGVALAVARESLGQAGGAVATASLGAVFLGGSLSAAAMMLPGMSGGTLLILLGLYDDMLAALNALYLPMLAVFGGGALIGMFVIARLVSALLARYPAVTGLFLAGMILGSARAVLPERLGAGEVLLTLAGAAAVLFWRGGETET